MENKVMSVAILDFSGIIGGVGRSTLEIIRQLEAMAVPTLYTGGQTDAADAFRARMPGLKHIHPCRLNRPRMTPAYLLIKYHFKHYGWDGRFSDLLIKLTRKKAAKISRSKWRSVFVNMSHFHPAPEREREFVVFVHDLSWVHYPDNFLDANLTHRRSRAWVERAKRVVANSEFTRDDVIQQYQCPPEKVIAAPLAPFADGGGEMEATSANLVLSRLGLVSGKYYLYPAVMGVHKGHDVLTNALERAEGTDPVVITCGNPTMGTRPYSDGIGKFYMSLARRWEKLAAQKRLVVVADLPETDMHVLRLNCKAFVLPSQFEGYGLPLAEAIYNHRPAIVSSIPASREILNRYSQYRLATLFPRESGEALAAELKRGPAEPPPMPAGWQKSVEKTWSWADTVGRILQALE